MTDPVEITTETPAPLQGCLYCHAEGTITQAEGRKLFGFGSGVPTLTCSACGAIAFFEVGSDAHSWRIRYKSFDRSDQYYYVMLYLGEAGWLNAEQALDASRNGYVQRLRLQQVEHSDLSFLHPGPLFPPPPLMAADEVVYITVNPATYQQAMRAGSVISSGDESVLDSGRFYVTDRKLHLLGHRRDWSHKLTEIQRIEHNSEYWRLYVGDSEQHYQGLNSPNQIDAQLFCAIVKHLARLDE
jgi:hypothetical protein